jgi:hypothetical protein
MKTLISMLLFLPLVASCATPGKAELDAEVRRLCAIDGGIKVYETVNLSADKFNKYGVAMLPPLKKNAKSSDPYYYEWDIQYLFRNGNPVDGGSDLARSNFKLYQAINNKLIGEAISYSRRGGDIPGPWHPSSFECPTDSGLVNLINSVFVPYGKGDTK